MRRIKHEHWYALILFYAVALLAIVMSETADAQPPHRRHHIPDRTDSVENEVQDEDLLPSGNDDEEIVEEFGDAVRYPVESVGGVYGTECSSGMGIQTSRIGISKYKTETYCVKLQMADAYMAAAAVCFDYYDDPERCYGYVDRSLELVERAGLEVDRKDKWYAGWRDTLLLRP